MTDQNNQQQIQVKISDEKMAGAYANMVQVGHSGEEFILDFMNLVPPAGAVVSRIIISPAHAKRFLAALAENIKNFESQYGSISSVAVPEKKIGFKTE